VIKTYGSNVGLNVVGDLEDEVLVDTGVRRVTTLGDGSIRVRGTVSVDLIGAVVLLVGLAVAAGKIGTDLCTDTNTVADLDVLDLASDLDY